MPPSARGLTNGANDDRAVCDPIPPSSVIDMRYRCNLGLWVLAGLMMLPLAVIHLLGPAFIAVTSAFAG